MITPEIIKGLDIVPGVVVLLRELNPYTGRKVINQVTVTQVCSGHLMGNWLTSSQQEPFNDETAHKGHFGFNDYELFMVMKRPVCRRQSPLAYKRLDQMEYSKPLEMVVEADWEYSFDGGGITGVIPDNQKVLPEWVGKTVKETGVSAWEYFRVPIYGRCERCGHGSCNFQPRT